MKAMQVTGRQGLEQGVDGFGPGALFGGQVQIQDLVADGHAQPGCLLGTGAHKAAKGQVLDREFGVRQVGRGHPAAQQAGRAWHQASSVGHPGAGRRQRFAQHTQITHMVGQQQHQPGVDQAALVVAQAAMGSMSHS
jgi:hypothetical protein